MSEIILKANINECKVENWQSNTGEVNARVMNVEMSEDLSSCDNQFVTFELADGTVYESKVDDDKANIPVFEKSQFIKIGLYAENSDGEKRYSSRPANVYVNAGSYPGGSVEPPKPTPGDYAELLEQLADLEKGTLKVITEQVNLWELKTGIYYLEGGWNYTKHLGSSRNERHIFIIYKTGVNAVRYIHFCGDNHHDVWSRIACGFTNGDKYTEYYVIDASQVTNDPKNDALGTKILNSAGVKNYVKEQLGVIDNGYY